MPRPANNPNRDPSSFGDQDTSVDPILAERGQELNAFVRGRMDGPSRAQFVKELEQDPALRRAVRCCRLSVSIDECPVSVAAAEELENAIMANINAASLFPGNSYISGLELRPDMRSNREGHYEKGIAHCRRLIELGELEDVALENIAIAERNIQAGRNAEAHFHTSNDATMFAGAVLSAWDGMKGVKRTEPNKDVPWRNKNKDREPLPVPEEALSPRFLPELALRAEDLLALDHSCEATRRQFERSLIVLYNERHREGTDAGDTEMRVIEALAQRAQKDPAFAEVLGDFSVTPLRTISPPSQISAQVIALTILGVASRDGCAHTTAQIVRAMHETASNITPAFMSYHRGNAAHLKIETIANLCAASDAAWEAIKPAVLGLFDNQLLSFVHGLSYTGPNALSKPSRKPEVLRALSPLAGRTETDPDLAERVQRVLASGDFVLLDELAPFARSLPQESAVVSLFEIAFKCDERMRTVPLEDESLDSDCFDDPREGSRDRAVFKLRNTTTTEDLASPQVAAALEMRGYGKNALEALRNLFQRQSDSSHFGYGYGYYETALIEMILKLDRASGISVMQQALSRLCALGRGGTVHAYLRLAQECSLDEMDESFCEVLAHGICENHSSRDVFDFLTQSRGMDKSRIAASVAAHVPAQPSSETIRLFAIEDQLAGPEGLEILTRGLSVDDDFARMTALGGLRSDVYTGLIAEKQMRLILANLAGSHSVPVFLGNSSVGEYARRTLLEITGRDNGIFTESAVLELAQTMATQKELAKSSPSIFFVPLLAKDAFNEKDASKPTPVRQFFSALNGRRLSAKEIRAFFTAACDPSKDIAAPEIHKVAQRIQADLGDIVQHLRSLQLSPADVAAIKAAFTHDEG